MLRRLRALLALAVLAALVAGVPWLLAATVGNPLNHWSDIRAGDMSDTDVLAIVAAIAYCVWGTFIVAVLVEAPRQLAAVVARRPARPAHLPGLGFQQHLARRLITTALMLAPLTLTTFGPSTAALAATRPVTATASATPAATAARPSAASPQTQHRPPTTAAVSLPAGHAGEAPRMYRIPETGGLRTYWAIAEHYLGSGAAWRQVWTLNEGRTQHDGSVMSSASRLQPGWTVLLPAHARPDEPAAAPAAEQTHETHTVARASGEHEVTVRGGDTLSGLAAADGVKDWHEVWPANAGRDEPGGRHFTDPNLILPGWKIALPDQPAAEQVAAPRPPAALHHELAPRHAAPHARSDASRPPSPPAQPPPPQERTAAATDRAAPAPAHPQVPPAAPTPRQGAPLQTEPALTAHQLGNGTSSDQATRSGASDSHDSVEASRDTTAVTLAQWTLTIGSGAGLLAGMLFTGMRIARRRRLRHRRPGRTLSGPAPEHLPLEAVLITDGAAAQRDVAFLDHALRVLASTLAATDGRLPALLAARLTNEHLDLVLAEAQLDAPPAPWVQASPTSWVITKTAELTPLEDLHPFPAAPYPTLVSVGWTPAGEEWLIDLEQAGALAFDGDPTRCLDLARFIVAELAYNPWSDPLLVTIAGFGEELVELNPERLIHTDDVSAAAAIATRSIDANREVADSHNIDVLHGRLHGISGDTWMPHVLVVAPHWAVAEADAVAVERLLSAAGQRASRSAVAVVLTADRAAASPAGLRLTVHPDGTLLIPDLEVIGAASQLPVGQAQALAHYFAAERAGRVDLPIPASTRQGGSAAYADAAGALRAEFKVPAPASAPRVDEATVIDLTAATTLPTVGLTRPTTGDRADGNAATVDRDQVEPTVHMPATVRPEVTDAVVASDPTLDADLADWHDPTSPRPKFDLLGPIAVHATGPVPTSKLQIVIEALLYLLLHPRGVTGDRFATDLWPTMNYVFAEDSNPRGIITLARHWVGADPATWNEYLVKASASKAVNGVGLYRLAGVLDSVDLFYRLRTRGEARGAEGRGDLMAALRLVNGVPLSALRPRGFGWLLTTGVGSDMLTSAIIDLADAVSTAALADGDVDQAREAARIALLTETPDDRPLLALAACQEREGRRSELGATVRQIMANHDEVLEDDVPDSTLEVLRRNGWLDLVNAN